MKPATRLLHAWRHPLPQGVTGRCIGVTDVPVDPRKAKRLAHRIRRACAGQPGPKCVVTSPLARCAAVGRALRGRGWRHHLDPALREMNFGRWEGQPWSAIPVADIDRWVADFADHAPGGGDRLRDHLARVAAWTPPDACGGTVVLVAHAGWMLARRWALQHGRGHVPAQARDWPPAPPHGSCWALAASVP